MSLLYLQLCSAVRAPPPELEQSSRAILHGMSQINFLDAAALLRPLLVAADRPGFARRTRASRAIWSEISLMASLQIIVIEEVPVRSRHCGSELTAPSNSPPQLSLVCSRGSGRDVRTLIGSRCGGCLSRGDELVHLSLLNVGAPECSARKSEDPHRTSLNN